MNATRKMRESTKGNLKKKRELAKTGMIASMGGVLLTGMMKSKKAHVVTGVAFMGFAYWHTTLYAQPSHKKRLMELDERLSSQSTSEHKEASKQEDK